MKGLILRSLPKGLEHSEKMQNFRLMTDSHNPHDRNCSISQPHMSYVIQNRQYYMSKWRGKLPDTRAIFGRSICWHTALESQSAAASRTRRKSILLASQLPINFKPRSPSPKPPPPELGQIGHKTWIYIAPDFTPWPKTRERSPSQSCKASQKEENSSSCSSGAEMTSIHYYLLLLFLELFSS